MRMRTQPPSQMNAGWLYFLPHPQPLAKQPGGPPPAINGDQPVGSLAQEEGEEF